MFPVRYFPSGIFAPKFFPPGTGEVGPRDISVSLSDSVGTGDSVGRTIVVLRTVSDVVAANDGVGRTTTLNRAVVDIVSPSDLLGRTYTGWRTVFDAAGFVDRVAKGQDRQVSDNVGATDIVGNARSLIRTLTDAIAPGDSGLPEAEFNRVVNDMISSGDEFAAKILEIIRELSETVSASDAISAGFLLSAILGDTVGVADVIHGFLRQTGTPCIVDVTPSSVIGVAQAVMCDLGTPEIGGDGSGGCK